MRIYSFIRLLATGVIALILTGCLKNIEENPTVIPEKLVGEYRNSQEVLTLHIDNTFIIKNDLLIDSGQWSLVDSNITLSANKSEIVYIKVYEVEGDYQLIIQDKKPQDPDTYDWSRVMTQIKNK